MFCPYCREPIEKMYPGSDSNRYICYKCATSFTFGEEEPIPGGTLEHALKELENAERFLECGNGLSM